jgi:hypothetical protein
MGKLKILQNLFNLVFKFHNQDIHHIQTMLQNSKILLEIAIIFFRLSNYN